MLAVGSIEGSKSGQSPYLSMQSSQDNADMVSHQMVTNCILSYKLRLRDLKNKYLVLWEHVQRDLIYLGDLIRLFAQHGGTCM